jgi:hypothetical protein
MKCIAIPPILNGVFIYPRVPTLELKEVCWFQGSAFGLCGVAIRLVVAVVIPFGKIHLPRIQDQ